MTFFLFYHYVSISRKKFYTGLTFIYTKDSLQLDLFEVQVVQPKNLYDYAMPNL